MAGEPGPRRVCLPWGYLPSGRNVRAVCSCGHHTTPRVDQARALDALLSEHGHTMPVCQTCGTDYTGHSWEQLRHDLEILTEPATGDEFLTCRGMPRSCRDGGAQRQLHLDRAAEEALGVPLLPERPRLRVIPGGADTGQTTAASTPTASTRGPGLPNAPAVVPSTRLTAERIAHRWRNLLRQNLSSPTRRDDPHATRSSATDVLVDALALADRITPDQLGRAVADQVALARGAAAAARYLTTLEPHDLARRADAAVGWAWAEHLLHQAADAALVVPDTDDDALAGPDTVLDLAPGDAPPHLAPVSPSAGPPAPVVHPGSAPAPSGPGRLTVAMPDADTQLAPAARERLARLAWVTTRVAALPALPPPDPRDRYNPRALTVLC
ncbi:hypothetical protein GCM10029964_091020 [Kibdelosporangium lantanae]